MRGLWLDDVRLAPEGYDRAYTAPEAIRMLSAVDYDVVSLDHDLGMGTYIGDGYDVVRWLEERAHAGEYIPASILVHSANPVAKRRMKAGIDAIQRIVNGL